MKSTKYYDPVPNLIITKETGNYVMFEPAIGKTDTLILIRGKTQFLDDDFEFTDFGDSLYFENYGSSLNGTIDNYSKTASVNSFGSKSRRSCLLSPTPINLTGPCK